MPFLKKSNNRQNSDVDEIIEGRPKRELEGIWKTAIYLFGVIMSLFHIYALAIAPMTRWHLYSMHILFGLVMTLSMYCATKKAKKSTIPWYDLLMIFAAVISVLYLILDAEAMAYRIGSTPNIGDLIVSGVIVLLILECTRRTSGNILPMIAIAFLLYSYFGKYIPGPLGHRGYRIAKTLSYMLSYDAIFSTPLSASATMVILFIIFGAFLAMSGSGQFFIDMAMSFTGSKRGGPAKVAVIASALFGTVSGNSVANVVSTGAFTIPMMKSTGYRSTFAAAVESTASTGGQLTPPILGSAAFIMAQLIGLPYKTIMLASIIPALLYFFTVFMMVDLEAIKNNLVGIASEKLPLKKKVLKEVYLLLPLAILIYMLSVVNASPIKSAMYAIGSTIVVYVIHCKRLNIRAIFDALSAGAASSCSLIASCATAGIVIGVLNMTGAGVKFASVIVSMSSGILYLALFLTMIASLLLGMGLPTTASYIICAAVAAPALIKLGLTNLQAHMFVFYFACVSAITPPVALAAYAAASIAKARPMQVAVTACKIGISAFIVPYMFCYAPSLLAQGDLSRVIITVVTAMVGCTMLSFGLQRQASIPLMPLYWPISIVLVVFSLFLLFPGSSSDIIGFIGSFITLGINYILMEREKVNRPLPKR